MKQLLLIMAMCASFLLLAEGGQAKLTLPVFLFRWNGATATE